MRQEIKYRRLFITDCSPNNHDFMTLFGIFSASLKPDMKFFEFKKYYCSARLDYIDATLVVVGGKDSWFLCCCFLSNGYKQSAVYYWQSCHGDIAKFQR